MKRGLRAIDSALLEWVRERCAVDDVADGCWVWGLSMHDGTQPQGKYLGKIINVRRVLLAQMAGGEYPSSLVAACRCETKGCVRPEHLYGLTRSKRLKGMDRSLMHCANLAKARRATGRLNQETVDAVRADPRPNTVVADEFGIGDSVVSQIRLHKIWRDYGNPFMSLAKWGPV